MGYFSECGYNSLPEEPVYDDTAPSRPTISKPKVRSGGKVVLSVTAERGASLVVMSGGKTVYKTTATGGRQLLSFKGRDGLRDYVVRATDSSDNVSSSAKFTVRADSKAPSLKGAGLKAGTAVNSRASIHFVAGEPVRYVAKVDGKRVASGRALGASKQMSFPVVDGRHRLVLQLTDAAGNVSTLRKTFTIAVAALTPSLEVVSTPREAMQRFRITGTPGSRGSLTFGNTQVPFELTGESVEVEADLSEDTYSDGTLAVRDQVGRRGLLRVPAFTVDSTAPTLKIRHVSDRSAAGRLVARVIAESGAQVAWRVLDGSGTEIAHASFRGTGKAQLVDVDAKEGAATLTVTATDAVGNETTDDLATVIDSDPLSLGDWVGILAFLGLLFGGGTLLWRRRGALQAWLSARRRDSEVRKARRAFEGLLRQHDQHLQHHAGLVANYRKQLGWWETRRQYLGRLLDEAKTTHGHDIVDAEILGTSAKKGERVFSVVPASLIEERSRDGVMTPVDVDEGQVAITSMRVLFQGRSKRREWAYDKLEQLTDIDTNATMLRVSNRKSLSGVRYDDPERTRLHLALAVEPRMGARHQIISHAASVLQRHIDSRPYEPAPPPEAPLPPSILCESQDVIPGARPSAPLG